MQGARAQPVSTTWLTRDLFTLEEEEDQRATYFRGGSPPNNYNLFLGKGEGRRGEGGGGEDKKPEIHHLHPQFS